MDSTSLVVIGGFLILIGFLSLIRSRLLSVRRRLTPAASIRTRGMSGGSVSYETGNSGFWRGVSLIVMLAGGGLVVASIALQ